MTADLLILPVLRCRHCLEDRPHAVSGTFYLTCRACGITRCSDRDCRGCATGGRP